jgi:hypothetical protein
VEKGIKYYTEPWRKSRTAARLLIQNSRRPLSPSRQALARSLGADSAVSNRLIKQALISLYAQRPHSVCLD